MEKGSEATFVPLQLHCPLSLRVSVTGPTCHLHISTWEEQTADDGSLQLETG